MNNHVYRSPMARWWYTKDYLSNSLDSLDPWVGQIWSRQTITETTEDGRRLRLSRTAQSGVGLRRYTCRLNVWFPTNSEHKTKLKNYSMKRLWLNTSAALFTV